jgi:hypothetical protein
MVGPVTLLLVILLLVGAACVCCTILTREECIQLRKEQLHLRAGNRLGSSAEDSSVIFGDDLQEQDRSLGLVHDREGVAGDRDCTLGPESVLCLNLLFHHIGRLLML